MWRLVREGVRFYGRILLISWGFGVGIFLLVLVVLAAVGSVRDLNVMARAGVQLPLAILVASMIAGFITTGTERSEARVRMQLMLPVPIGEVAIARVLLPTVLLGGGLVMAHLLFALLLALEGSPVLSPRHLNVDFIAVQLLFWLQLALAVREIIELRHRKRWRAALPEKGVLILAVTFMVLLQLGPFGSVGVKVGLIAALNLAIMAFTVALFRRRTSFTK